MNKVVLLSIYLILHPGVYPNMYEGSTLLSKSSYGEVYLACVSFKPVNSQKLVLWAAFSALGLVRIGCI